MSGVALLVLAVLGATHVGVGVVGVRRPIRFSYVLFVLGLLSGDLAWWNIVWSGAATALLVHAGALDNPPGVFGLVVMVGPWAALVHLQAQQSRARHILGRALDTSLARANPLASLRPWHPPRSRVAVEQHRYGAHPRQIVEVLRPSPASVSARLPVLFHVHGGSWTGGTPHRQSRTVRWHLARHGWLSVAPGYRVSPASTFPDHLVDVKRALAWVRTNARELGADPDLVVVSGGSAGGHLAALLALTPGDPALQPGFEDADTSVSACVALYAVLDLLDRHGDRPGSTRPSFLEHVVMKTAPDHDRERWDAASPICRVHADAPPFLVVHGAHDTLVWPEEAASFVRALRAASHAPVVSALLPGAQHAFDALTTVRSLHAAEAVRVFAEQVRDAARSDQAAAPADLG
ncbi:MAG TPA: alpha/beta hydrolase [Acidimicrobiia bacterium]|nr:alpha/beta hydrolase [Acidimicrobiia bacterium]